jgi:hypothetical protein
MNKKEFKEKIYEAFNNDVQGITFEEKILLIERIFIEYQKDNEESSDLSNKGKSWKDEELKIILSSAPTKSNCLKYAKIFKRGYGSIEQIYRWSTTTEKDIKEVRPDDKFIAQIKNVAKELGLRG